MKPIAIGTLVDYHGSHKHGRYVVTAHHDPATLFTAQEVEWLEKERWPGGLAERHPDGVCYEIWPEGMEQSWRNREHMVYRVKRASLTVVSCTREGFEPMVPFAAEEERDGRDL